MSKHTPGPWSAERYDGTGFHGWNIFTTDCDEVANADEYHYFCIANEDDARLIAAAPEMAEALKTLLENCDLGRDGEAVASAALAKAGL